MGNIGLEPEITREYLAEEYRKAVATIADLTVQLKAAKEEIAIITKKDFDSSFDKKFEEKMNAWWAQAGKEAMARAEKAEARIIELEAEAQRRSEEADPPRCGNCRWFGKEPCDRLEQNEEPCDHYGRRSPKE